MTAESATWLLLGLGVLAVVLTRLRLGKDTSGHGVIPMAIVQAHTVNGSVVLILSIAYMLSSGGGRMHAVGSVAGVLWWLEAVLAVGVLMRWLPRRGRHAIATHGDGWTDGPWLSLVAHLGTVFGVALMTMFFVTSRI